jgi:hypothetical protein
MGAKSEQTAFVYTTYVHAASEPCGPWGVSQG